MCSAYRATEVEYVDCSMYRDVFGFFSPEEGYNHNYFFLFGEEDMAYLPDVSYYYSSRPSFLPADYTWPTIGPGVTGPSTTQSIPAKARFSQEVKTYIDTPVPRALQHAGTLYDQTWSGTHNVTGNIIVPSGTVLTIAPGTTINFSGNSYITVQPGGSIVAQGPVAFNPADRSVRYSGTMSSYNVWGFPVLVTDNLTANTELVIHPGTMIKVNPGKRLLFNYHFTAEGTSSNPIIFQSNGGTWYGIELNYCSQTALKYCTVQNASYGTRAYHTTLNLENCIFTSNGIGLKYDNQSGGYVKNSTISSCYSGGIDCSQNSNPTIHPYNHILSNSPAGICGDENSLPELGTSWNAGNNSLENFPDEVWSDCGSTLYAVYNYWGSSSPNPSVSENVEWEPYLTSDPTGGGMLNRLAGTGDTPRAQRHAGADTSGRSEFAKAYETYLRGNYSDAKVLFESIVSKYPDAPAGLQALAFIDYCYQNLDNTAASMSYLNQVSDAYAGKEISALASSIAVGHLVKTGAYKDAISKSEQILADYTDRKLGKYALYDLGTIYWYYLDDREAGEMYYRQLIAQWPEDHLAASALATLGEWKPAPSPSQGSGPSLAKLPSAPSEYGLSQNFPNPFSPQTAIHYQLPEATRVSLKVYNILGQVVRTLVDGHQEGGYYTVVWDGRDDHGSKLATGVYVYQLSVQPSATRPEGFVTTRKIMVIQ